MSKKSIVIFVIAAFVVIIGIVLATGSGAPTNSQPQAQDANSSANGSVTTPPSKSSIPTTTTTDTSTTNTPTTDAPRVKMYGMTEVATHNSSSSCWSVVDGSVYDLTSWIRKHPGGAGAIMSMCGKDGSAAFDDQHGGERRPANELAGFKIGQLGQ